jgi:GNAT superfamily N-acetyltransferase
MTAPHIRFSGIEHQPLKLAAQDLALTLDHDVPAGAQRLVWNEFFVSRGRGIDWTTHLPWATDGSALCASATVTADDTVVATLLIRIIRDTTTAMIGCVCVDPAFRGYGLSGRLIDLAAPPLDRMGVNHMLLWTGKPGVYERSGFVVTAQERRLALRAPVAAPAIALGPATLTPWPADDEVAVGLPPFATAGWCATTYGGRIVFVDTPAGAALLDHAGSPDAVLATMFAARGGDWTATLDATDSLYEHAVSSGACTDDAPGPLTMLRALGPDTAPPAYVPPAFRI